jgi:HEAT repeat protein
MKFLHLSFPLSLLAATALTASAEEREVTPEQQAAVAAGGDLTDEAAERPKNLPDLTKGQPLPVSKDPPQIWNLGPTGISCIMAGGFPGDQLLVKGAIKGSPAEGKLLPGDVITGINGKKFEAGGHLGEFIGNAIIEAEKETNGGKMVLQVWRDKNYPARSGTKNIAGVDIDKLINEAESDDSLYDWKPEEARKVEVAKMDLDKFPLDPMTLDVELKLRVFPAYTDTAPYDCPKTKQILEDAWRVLEKRFVVDPKDPRSGKGGVIEAMALIASGKPEHRELVKQWVRSKNCPWQPPTQPIGAMFEPGYKGYMGYQSWHHGFIGLNCALYYDATGDDYVLPALRKYAIETAMGQSKAGTWGHTFAYPSFNGGQFHLMNPGYGALNAAGNRCFFLIVLARKLGVEHPEIDAAIKRAHSFFGSYVDQGAIPYGDHAAAGTDDSNGKNTGIAFAMKLLGDDYGAKYFAMMSSHCAFTRRGGHGHDYHGEWSSWAASLCGPKVRAFNERNLRWRRTLCRMYDGSFVYHSPTGKYSTLRDPTSTEVFHQAAYLKQTLITGKDANESYYPTEREMKQLLASAYGQFNNDWLKELAGKPWKERSTDELFDLLDIFMPKARRAVATELGKRFQAGESAIGPRLVTLLAHESARYRHGALCGLDACGNDVMLSNLSKIIPMLEATEDFVRITAVEVVSKATNDKDVQLALLKTSVADRTATSPNSVRNAVQTSFIASKIAVSQSPFQAGFDENLVEQALTNLILEETGGGPLVQSKVGVWDKDTVIRLAGPLTYIAEEEQVFDQMFGARNAAAQAMLGKFGYLEAAQSSGYRIRKKVAIPRHIRAESGFKDPLIHPDVVVKNPGVFAELADEIKTILIDNPLEEIVIKDDSTNWLAVTTPLSKVLKTIEEHKKPAALPSIGDDVRRLFQAELSAAEGTGAKMKLCRGTLANPERMDTFHKIAAMDQLVELSGADALEDLLPYLGHEQWRLREHSRRVASPLAKGMAGEEISKLFASAADAPTKGGLLELLALAKPKTGLDVAKQSMKHESSVVRASAVNALSSLGGDAVTEEILTFLRSAETREERIACENALLARIGDPAAASRIRDRLISLQSGASPDVLDSCYYLIARIGDAKCIDILRTAATTQEPAEFSRVMYALSYSPSRDADKVMLDIAAANPKRAQLIGPHAVRRMVIGPKGYGDITSTQRMDFADALLKLTLEQRIVKLLGTIHEARALTTLMYCLEKGVASAAGSLITNAEGMEKLSPADSKIAAKALQDVIEYIEVTRLRGGIKAHMNKEDHYTEWKALQARAGKALLKVHKPETAPIPGFDSLELND